MTKEERIANIVADLEGWKIKSDDSGSYLEDKELLSLQLSSFLFYQLTSSVESRDRKETSNKTYIPINHSNQQQI